jgi:hypothetical protein
MRRRDPHDDPPAKRRPSPYRGEGVTLGHMRAHGVRRLLIYCSAVSIATTAGRSTPITGRMKRRCGTYARKRCARGAGSSAPMYGRIGRSGRGGRA